MSFSILSNQSIPLIHTTEKALESRTVGRAHVGGPFDLTSHENKLFSDKDLLGKWSFVYFGFTNCPDICPAELDKIGSILTPLGKISLPSYYAYA